MCMIDPELPDPVYVQLANILRKQIQDGTITSRLPSVRTLAQTYGLAHMTVTKALTALKEEGLIVSVKGRGYFIKRNDPDLPKS